MLLGSVFVALLLVMAVGYVWPEDERISTSLRAIEDYGRGSVTFFFVADDVLIAPHLYTSRTEPDGRVFLVRLDGGELRAFEARDTLYGGPIAWNPQYGIFVEPSRGSLYEIDGSVRHGPATRALDEYHVEVVGGQVRVDLGRLVSGAEVTR